MFSNKLLSLSETKNSALGKTKKEPLILCLSEKKGGHSHLSFFNDDEDLGSLCVITITVHFYSDNFIPG